MGRKSKEILKRLELQAVCTASNYKNNFTFFNKTMEEAIEHIRSDAKSRGIDLRYLQIRSKK